ncbi:MAG: PAS domain S-box protein, partial [Planctomycetes bacterium]|nr:PAS domain S-box protein [Planctomycetota bacterium]
MPADDQLPPAPSPPPDLLQRLFAVLSPALGEDFFRSLTHHLTRTCGVDFALVGKLQGPALDRVQTLAVAHRGEPVADFEYGLADTPCEHVVGRDLCCFDAGVADRFPADRMLRELGIQSYLGTPLFGSRGQPIGLLAVMHRQPLADVAAITTVVQLAAERTAAEVERLAAQQALGASEARLSAVVDGSPSVAMQWFDRSGRVLRWNRASELLYGYAAGEAIGRTLGDLTLTPAQMDRFLANFADIERTGRAIEPSEYPFRRRDGSTGVTLSTVFPIPGEGDAPWFVCMDVDITDRKLAEQQRARVEQQMLAAQKLESLGVLAGGVAHDFNNLLTAMLGRVRLLAAELTLGSSAAEHLQAIDTAARRAADLTQQMLAYAGRATIVSAPFCLAAAVREMATLLRSVVSRRVDLQFELEPAVVDGDSTPLQQVVMNLITNAGEAIGERAGRVVVRTGVRRLTAADLECPHLQVTLPVGDYAVLEVDDDGPGMDAATAARIFEPFFSTKWTGRGLGLATVLGVVRAHHGGIRVDSAPGRGTVMTVLLPHSTNTPAPGNPPPASAPRASGRVLVIDDEGEVRRATRLLLERAGFAVSEAGSGDEGIRLVQASPGAFDAVLIDLTMPRLDGWQVAARIHAAAPSLPRVLMSGYADPRPPTA